MSTPFKRLRPTAFRETMRHVQADALVNTMQYSLSEAETLGNTLPDVKAQAIVAFLADTVEEAQRETYTNKLANIKANTLDEMRH